MRTAVLSYLLLLTKRRWTVNLGLTAWLVAGAAMGEVSLIGTASIPATEPDLAQGQGAQPQRRHALGGFSAIDYTGADHRYLIAADRGPDDGQSDYRVRFHEYQIVVRPESRPAIQTRLLASHLLRDAGGEELVGSRWALDARRTDGGARFDPEGLRRMGQRLYIADEYGPWLAEFDLVGRRRQIVPLPPRLLAKKRCELPEDELRENSAGRIPNRGFEGLASTPDGRTLYAILQGPLIQDSESDGKGKRYGDHVRLVQLDLDSGRTREFAVPLSKKKAGFSELLYVGQNQLLVLERDGEAGEDAKCKRIDRLDLTGATDLSGIESLPAEGLPSSVRPAAREPFIDLLSPRFGLAGPQLAEKFEGLAFGPRMADGSLLLLVTVDNDFVPDQVTQIHAFRVSPDELPAYAWPY